MPAHPEHGRMSLAAARQVAVTGKLFAALAIVTAALRFVEREAGQAASWAARSIR